MRVQIPSYSSAFRRGAHTGTVIATGDLTGMGDGRGKLKIARVLLDGPRKKTILVDLGDCIPLKENHHAG